LHVNKNSRDFIILIDVVEDQMKKAAEISNHYLDEIFCIDASREGVFAFLKRRKANFAK